MTIRRPVPLRALVLVALTAGSAWAVKQTGGEYNTMHAGRGAKGYDVVSYFTEGQPELGSDDYTHPWGGVIWHFTSREHRDLFAATPTKYAPRFGGFCSWGVAHGKLFDVDPVNGWTIRDGGLYLNFNADVNAKFAADADTLVEKANANWPALNR